jgi:hypothetical protein
VFWRVNILPFRYQISQKSTSQFFLSFPNSLLFVCLKNIAFVGYERMLRIVRIHRTYHISSRNILAKRQSRRNRIDPSFSCFDKSLSRQKRSETSSTNFSQVILSFRRFPNILHKIRLRPPAIFNRLSVRRNLPQLLLEGGVRSREAIRT